MTRQDAINYINLAIKEGYESVDKFDDMSNKQKIEWAEYNADKGDNEAKN